jgi:hypothetical protein
LSRAERPLAASEVASQDARLTLPRLAIPASGLALLGLATVVYLLDYPLYFQALSLYGAYPLKVPFLDLDNVTASVQCWRRGVDVYVNNPCDLLGRPFSYSPVWLRVVFLPAGALWRNVSGLGLDVAFILSQYFVCRPASWREAATFVAAGISSVVVFASERANVDLAIFLILVGVGVLGAGSLGRRLAAYAAILLAGFLKFYPFVALVVALRERRWIFPGVLVTSVAAIGAFYFGFRSDLVEMSHNIPQGRFGIDAFGSTNLIYALPVIDASAALRLAVLGVLIVLALAVALSLSLDARFAAAFAGLSDRNKTYLTLGAAVIVGCFFAGQSINYRGVFLILVIPGLLAMHRGSTERAFRSRLAWLTATVIALMWWGGCDWLFSLIDHGRPFWLIREALWWYIAAALLGVLITFVRQSESIITAPIGRWLSRSGS